jgi:hypothetical protein
VGDVGGSTVLDTCGDKVQPDRIDERDVVIVLLVDIRKQHHHQDVVCRVREPGGRCGVR